MTRCLAPTIGLLAALAPALAHAQTNLDQGKSAAQIFATDCAECHKAPHGLANGKNSAALTDFLREHYTTSREQAAALASYVLGGRASEPIGSAPQGQQAKKPATQHNASAEEPKPTKRQARRPAKPEAGASASPKPQRPTDAAAEPKEEEKPDGPPSLLRAIVRPEGGQHENRLTTTGNRRNEPKPPQPPKAPAAVARSSVPVTAAPASTATLSRDASPTPTAAAPADNASGESGDAPVPRDNIPD